MLLFILVGPTLGGRRNYRVTAALCKNSRYQCSRKFKTSVRRVSSVNVIQMSCACNDLKISLPIASRHGVTFVKLIK